MCVCRAPSLPTLLRVIRPKLFDVCRYRIFIKLYLSYSQFDGDGSVHDPTHHYDAPERNHFDCLSIYIGIYICWLKLQEDSSWIYRLYIYISLRSIWLSAERVHKIVHWFWTKAAEQIHPDRVVYIYRQRHYLTSSRSYSQTYICSTPPWWIIHHARVIAARLSATCTPGDFIE